MTKQITRKMRRKTMQRAFVSLVLILYFGACQIDLLHSLVHNHGGVTADVFNEKINTCEKMLFRDGTQQGCDHHSHLTASDHCHMCDVASHGDQIITFNVEFSLDYTATKYFDQYKLSLGSYWAVISSSRAPPVFA